MTHDAIWIQTPEGVRFSLPLAGLVSRFLAWLVDALAISVLCSFAGKGLMLLSVFSADLGFALTAVSYFVISIGYGIAFEWTWRGQTPGKRIFSLRVLDVQGLRLQPAQIALRNLLRSVDSLPGLYLVGGLAALLSRHRQRLGDMVAHTIVVTERRLALPDLTPLKLDEKYNSLLSVPHLAARLRQKTTPELVEISYQALLRGDQLEPAVKLEIFQKLAARFRALVAFPEELTAGMTDERYVRNALQVALTAGRFRNVRERKEAAIPS